MTHCLGLITRTHKMEMQWGSGGSSSATRVQLRVGWGRIMANQKLSLQRRTTTTSVSLVLVRRRRRSRSCPLILISLICWSKCGDDCINALLDLYLWLQEKRTALQLHANYSIAFSIIKVITQMRIISFWLTTCMLTMMPNCNDNSITLLKQQGDNLKKRDGSNHFH